MKLENEKALIRTIAEGNTKSFEVLFYSYYPRFQVSYLSSVYFAKIGKIYTFAYQFTKKQ